MSKMQPQSVICEIWSHSHAPPLRPAANLSFDLRKLPNPPKHIRDRYDGRSKRLREHLIHETAFTELLDHAVQQISQAADDVIRRSRISSDGVEAGASHDSTHSGGDKLAGSTYKPTSFDGRDPDGSAEKEYPLPESGETVNFDVEEEECSEQQESDPVLCISCFCERGRHISVAFAEELGRRLDKVPATETVQILVQVQHRDVEVKPKGSSRMRGSGRGGSRVYGAAMIADYEEVQDVEE